MPLKPLYRYFKSSIGDHFYTATFSELACGAQGYTYEGTMGYLLTTSQSGTVPLYRFSNALSGHHYYSTTNGAPTGYSLDGITGYLFSNQEPATAPIYQATHVTQSDTIYTIDPNELSSFPPNTFVYTGTIGYIYPGPAGGWASVCNCSTDQPTDGETFQLSDSTYTSTTVPLKAAVPGALAEWTLETKYSTIYNSSDHTFRESRSASTIADGVARVPFSGVGGTVTLVASCEACAATRSITIRGVAIPDSMITSRLLELYTDGATPNLLTGIAMKESTYRQFRLTDGKPTEPGGPSGGSHIGLMQMPTSMTLAWNWLENTRQGALLFRSKLASALRIESRIRAKHPGLPALTDVQREDMALVLYGPAAQAGEDNQYYVPMCVGGVGPMCVGGSWQWTVNVLGNTAGVVYATEVRRLSVQ